MPMGTSAGLGGTMPFSVQPGKTGYGSATYGDFPGPATMAPGPMQSMPMPAPMPAATSASIPAAMPAQMPMPAPAPMPAPMPAAMPAQMPISAPAPQVQQQWIPGPARPIMASVAAPP